MKRSLNAGLMSVALVAGLAAASHAADYCSVDIHTNLYGNLYGNPAVKCEYKFNMVVNNNGSITSSGGTRACTGNQTTQLGPGSGSLLGPGASTDAQITFPYIAGIYFDLPSEAQEGRWTSGLVATLGDRGGSSTVTSSSMLCVDR